MELTILGKYGPYPKALGACSGYLVKCGGCNLLLDAGSGVLSRLAEIEDISKLSGIFISHSHFDHTSDLLPLQYMLEDLKCKLNIYTKFEKSKWYNILYTHPNFNIINVDEGSKVKIGSAQLEFIRMQHIESSLAVIIKEEGKKSLCYTGDTMYCPAVEKCFKMSDIILADCSKPSGFKAKHMTVDDAKMLSLKYPGKTIIATHQSIDYDPAQELKGYKNIICAEENLTLEI